MSENRKYKLLAFDMDGTLLTDKKEISEENLEALYRAKDAGVSVVVATGRPIQGVELFPELLDFGCPVIAQNGSQIYSFHKNEGASGTEFSKELLFSRYHTEKQVKDVIDVALFYDASLCIWSGEKLFANKIDERVNAYRIFCPQITSVDGIADIPFDRITKMFWFNSAEKIQESAKGMRQILIDDEIDINVGYTYAEFFPKDISKGSGLKQVTEMLGFSAEDTVAIGDAVNDVQMLKYAGYAAVPANADNRLLANADFVSTGNNESAVAVLINKLFSEGKL